MPLALEAELKGVDLALGRFPKTTKNRNSPKIGEMFDAVLVV